MKTRRDFIKISALGLGATAAMGGAAKWVFGAPFENLLARPDDDSPLLKRFPTYCEVCFWKCAAWAYVTPEGSIQKIIGNADDPQCNGRLCPRGTGGVGMFSDPDRLKKPLIRVIQDGKQTYREASWDEALDFVSGKMKEIASKNGPESMALFFGSLFHSSAQCLWIQ
jgi:thiosulfate reductase/polysulfide reductase chain A